MLVMKQVSFLSSSNPIRVLSNAYLRGWIATERILFHVIIYKHDITVLHFTVNSTALGIAFSIKATIKLSMCLHEAPRFRLGGGGMQFWIHSFRTSARFTSTAALCSRAECLEFNEHVCKGALRLIHMFFAKNENLFLLPHTQNRNRIPRPPRS